MYLLEYWDGVHVFRFVDENGEVEGEGYPSHATYYLTSAPNPFNSETIVNYYLPFRTQLTLNVYDSSGRLIQQLYNGFQQAGRHSTVWKQVSLPSGNYILRLSTPDLSTFKNITLIK